MEDGTVYRGFGFGAAGDGGGEIVFNTAITGYQEVLTDPSYRGQIVTMTAPEIGNVGINPVDFESARPWCAGLRRARAVAAGVELARVGRRCTRCWRTTASRASAGIDTRAVTRRIRLSGAQRAVITRAVGDAAARGRARAPPPVAGGPRPGARGDRHRRPTSGTSRCGGVPGTAGAVEAPPKRFTRRRLRLRHQARHPAPAAQLGLPGHASSRRRRRRATCWR